MGEGLGCPWVSPSVNNEVGRLGWKKGYFHCSSDVTFSTGCSPQDSFSYFLFRFPAPHSSFGILDIVLFCFWHQKMDSWKFLHPLWQPAPAFTDIHSPRMSHDSPWADYLPPPQLLLLFKVRGRRRILLALWTPSFPSTVSAVRGSPLRYSLAKADVLFFLGRCFLKCVVKLCFFLCLLSTGSFFFFPIAYLWCLLFLFPFLVIG